MFEFSTLIYTNDQVLRRFLGKEKEGKGSKIVISRFGVKKKGREINKFNLIFLINPSLYSSISSSKVVLLLLF